jgi:hypothetical protein
MVLVGHVLASEITRRRRIHDGVSRKRQSGTQIPKTFPQPALKFQVVSLSRHSNSQIPIFFPQPALKFSTSDFFPSDRCSDISFGVCSGQSTQSTEGTLPKLLYGTRRLTD